MRSPILFYRFGIYTSIVPKSRSDNCTDSDGIPYNILAEGGFPLSKSVPGLIAGDAFYVVAQSMVRAKWMPDFCICTSSRTRSPRMKLRVYSYTRPSSVRVRRWW